MIGKTPITGEPVLFAPGREQRPNVYDGAPCPFCPGAEHQTPPEIDRDGDPWRIRVFPNRYPPTEHAEVVVESAGHEDEFDSLAPGHAQRVVDITFARYRALAAKAAYVCIFKNHGRLAGASIPHLHSQLVGTPFVPLRPAREGDAFARTRPCTICEFENPVIAETEHYRWIAPRGARFAYQQWILPKAHEHDLNEPRELATLMQFSARAMRSISDAFNWTFMTFPHQRRGHWYLELFPRMAMIAGFEIGSGVFVNSVGAEDAARTLSDASSRRRKQAAAAAGADHRGE